jgi:hypothetical protein
MVLGIDTSISKWLDAEYGRLDVLSVAARSLLSVFDCENPWDTKRDTTASRQQSSPRIPAGLRGGMWHGD